MNLNELLGKPESELDALFRSSQAGPVPDGNAAGEAIWTTGTFITRLFARFVHDFAWQGKVFTRQPDGTTTLLNKLGPEGKGRHGQGLSHGELARRQAVHRARL